MDEYLVGLDYSKMVTKKWLFIKILSKTLEQ